MSESPPRTSVEAELSETEHQAFDLLAELPLAQAWAADQRGDPGADIALQAALDHAGEDLEMLRSAELEARRALVRVTNRVATSLLDAARALAQTQEAGALDPEGIDAARAALEAEGRLGAGAEPARELVSLCLGLDPASIASGLLESIGEDARDRAPAPWSTFVEALDERVRAAWPASEGAQSEKPPPSPTPLALRVFRSATVVDAGVDIRARALAADDPDQIGLAQALARRLDDPTELVERFERARAEASERGTSIPDPAAKEPSMDGPKRKFTAGHLILALVVLGLTLWHYVWR